MERADFVRSTTRIQRTPLVPEIALHLAEEPFALWERTGDAAPPFWAFAWSGGQALARHILDTPHTVAGKRVVDLGSGSGMVAIAAALAGAAVVTAYDIDPFSSAAVAANSALNDVDVAFRCEDVLEREVDADVVLGGDLFYDREMAARVMPFLERFGGEVLVGDPGREYLPGDRFEVVARHVVRDTAVLEGNDVTPAAVGRLVR